MKKNTILTAIVLLIISVSSSRAQFIEDALRYGRAQAYTTARADGFGVAFHGVSDDLAALRYNPAGMSLIPNSEFSIGFGFRHNQAETDFLDIKNSFNSNDASINHIGLVSPFKISTGNAAIGIGYFMEQNFDNNYSFEGFNTQSTMIQAYANSGADWAKDLVYDQGLAMEREDYTLKTPLTDSLTQKAFVTTSGGLHNITAAGGFDLNKFLSAGFSISGKFGSFDMTKKYEEIDTRNVYNEYDEENWDDLDFNSLSITERLNQSVSGITAGIGLQAKVADFMRIGVKIDFPTFYHVEESFSTEAQAYFDGYTPERYESEGNTSYNLSTPWIYSGGMSFHMLGLTVAAGIEYSDASQLEFSDGLDDLNDLNLDIVRELIGQTTWGLGAEYRLPILPVAVRAGYSSITSPYTDDIAGATVRRLSLGAGVYLGKIRLDGLMRFNDYSELMANYNSDYPGSQYVINYSPVDVTLQFTYRFD